MNVTLYTTHCPKCKILTKKLEMAGAPFTQCEDIQEMMRMGFKSAPILKVDDQIYLFKEACLWADDYKHEHQGDK